MLESIMKFLSDNSVVVVVTEIGAIATIVGVIITILAYKAANAINHSVNIQSARQRYWSAELGNALRTLYKKEDGYKQIFSSVVLRSEDSNSADFRVKISDKMYCKDSRRFIRPWAKEDDSARRLVKGFFLMVYQDWWYGLISSRDVKTLCTASSVNALLKIVEPMCAMACDLYDNEMYYAIMAIDKGEMSDKEIKSNIEKFIKDRKDKENPIENAPYVFEDADDYEEVNSLYREQKNKEKIDKLKEELRTSKEK